MSDNKNQQLAVLVMMVLGAVAILLYLMVGEGCKKNADCPDGMVCSAGSCVAKPNVAVVPPCLGDSNCPPGQICVGGVCDKEEPPEEGSVRPACALGEPVQDCECKVPYQEVAGKCARPPEDPRCADPTFIRVCQNVVRDCAGSLGGACAGDKWKDLMIGDDSVAALLGTFTDQVALLFPTSQPVANSNWPPDGIKTGYGVLIRQHVQTLFDAKMIVLLGRASPIGNAADNDALAARRLNAAKNWLFDACRATNHSDDECNALAARVAPAAVGQGRVIRRGEFIKAFHPTLRRSGQVVREKRWTLPVDETMMQAPNPIPGKRDIIKQNGAKQARADSVLAVALGRTNNRQHQRVAEQFMNQAAMFIPVPCSCKTN